MQLYCGIDLHSNNSLISIVDADDKIIAEQRLANSQSGIHEYLKPFQSEIQGIVVESTYNWYWLVDSLVEQGYPVHLANTQAIQQYRGLKHTNDATDARFLAHLLRLNILPTGFIYPKQARHLRDLLRRRLLLVEHRTAQKLCLKSMIARHSAQSISSLKLNRLSAPELDQFFDTPESQFSARQILRAIQGLNKQISDIEDYVESHCSDSQQYRCITSVPGIGKIIGLSILLETGPIERFASAGNYASYARCVPSSRISNGKVKGQGNTKNGNRYLALAFMQAAHYATIWDKTIKRYYQRKRKKVHVMVAKKTVANKLCKACYHMQRSNSRFNVDRAFS